MESKVEISVSYFKNGAVKSHVYEHKSENVQALFDNAIKDANEFARLRNGQVSITRKIDSLYINYLDIKCGVIDRMYQVSKSN
jgi:hypothetical protein